MAIPIGEGYGGGETPPPVESMVTIAGEEFYTAQFLFLSERPVQEAWFSL
jgi:hypothetical protein